MRYSSKQLSLNGLFAAMVAIATIVIQIPAPATGGYIHLGDSIILIISIFFGWQYGVVAGGLGSVTADLLTGYAYWGPFSLLIKALMGFAAGKIGSPHKKTFSWQNLAAAAICEIIMIFGYLLCGTLLKSSLIVALESLPFNIMQGVGSIILFIILGEIFRKTNLYQRFKQIR